MSPSKSLRTRLIHVSPSYWTTYCSFEIILEWGLSIGLELKLNVLFMQIHCFKKKFNLIRIIFEKMLYCRGKLGLLRMSPSKARANLIERTPPTVVCRGLVMPGRLLDCVLPYQIIVLSVAYGGNC